MNRPPHKIADQPQKRGSGEAERRVSERFTFSAVAELVDVVSLTRITACVSDISSSGCYLDVINVFVPGTKAQLAIRHANVQFDALAIVAYSLPGMGIGVTFNAINHEMSAVLDRGIAELKGEVAPVEATPEVNRMVQNYPRIERHILGRLIGLMMRKNMLAREEDADLLNELLRENKD